VPVLRREETQQTRLVCGATYHRVKKLRKLRERGLVSRRCRQTGRLWLRGRV